jgi:hypothetical protein
VQKLRHGPLYLRSRANLLRHLAKWPYLSFLYLSVLIFTFLCVILIQHRLPVQFAFKCLSTQHLLVADNLYIKYLHKKQRIIKTFACIGTSYARALICLNFRSTIRLQIEDRPSVFSAMNETGHHQLMNSAPHHQSRWGNPVGQSGYQQAHDGTHIIPIQFDGQQQYQVPNSSHGIANNNQSQCNQAYR